METEKLIHAFHTGSEEEQAGPMREQPYTQCGKPDPRVRGPILSAERVLVLANAEVANPEEGICPQCLAILKGHRPEKPRA